MTAEFRGALRNINLLNKQKHVLPMPWKNCFFSLGSQIQLTQPHDEQVSYKLKESLEPVRPID
jgi:hypothetical protein